MKGLFKLLVFAGLVGVVVLIAMRVRRKPHAEPRGIRPTPWEPPVVVPPLQPTEERVAVSEDEGMQPPPAEPAGDVPRDSEGDPLISEFAAPGAPEAAIEQTKDETPDEETRLSVADEEGMSPPAQETEDAAVGSSGTPVVSELASPGAPESVAPSTTELPAGDGATGEDEGTTSSADGPAEDVAVGSSGEPVISELAAPGAPEAAFAAAESLDDGMPDFSALLEEAEDLARGEAWLESVAEESPEATADGEEAGNEPDFLTKYFDELAATPEEALAPGASPTAEPPPLGEPAIPAVPRLHAVEEALDDLEPAPIVPPPRRTAESYLDEGNVYFNVGQYGLAIERYGQAVGLDDTLTAAFYNRANAHTRAGDFEKALADYDRALELQPADADALNNRGMLHLYRANYTDALRDFNGALNADPTDMTVMVNRGLARLHGGDSAAALEDFREAARMDDGDAAAQYGAAQAAASMGNKEEALGHVARALELDPGYAREAAGDPRLSSLQGDDEFLRLLRQSGTRSGS